MRAIKDKDKINEIIKMHTKEHMSSSDIADIFGYKSSSIKKLLGDAGVYNPDYGIDVTKKEKKKHINTDRYLCKTCQYRIGKNYRMEGMRCNYIEVTGHMRGCDAADCDKYVKGKMLTKKLGKIAFSDINIRLQEEY